MASASSIPAAPASPLPILFKKNDRSKYQQWRTWTEGATMFTEYGQCGGKLRIVSRECKGKNLNRSNATTDEQQAIAEAKSKHTEQITKKLYSITPPSPEGLEGKKVEMKAEMVGTLNTLPMLAEKYAEHPPKTWPQLVQPKIDGCRSSAILMDGAVEMRSRNNKLWPFFLRVKVLLLSVLQQLEAEMGCEVAIDGELYQHGIGFQTLTSIARQAKKPHPEEDKLQYWIFDIILSGEHSKMAYPERWALLNKYVKSAEVAGIAELDETLKLLPYKVANSSEEFDTIHQEFMDLRYEGSMLRDPSAPYMNKKCRVLLKRKDFVDAEFEIVEGLSGQGVETGCVVWKLKTEKGQFFTCRPKGTHETRAEQYVEREKYVGKMLTVRYQEMSDEGVPRFPVGVGVRDYE